MMMFIKVTDIETNETTYYDYSNQNWAKQYACMLGGRVYMWAPKQVNFNCAITTSGRRWQLVNHKPQTEVRTMTNHIKANLDEDLRQFALDTLRIMENRQEWCADVVDDVHESARRHSLATYNDEGYYVRPARIFETFKKRYTAGWNMPGCLPETDPVEFDTFDEAKRFIIDTLKEREDEYGVAGDEHPAERCCHLAEDVNLESGPFSADAVDGYAYWVEELAT